MASIPETDPLGSGDRVLGDGTVLRAVGIKNASEENDDDKKPKGGFMKKYGWWWLLVLVVAGGIAYWLFFSGDNAPRVKGVAEIAAENEAADLRKKNSEQNEAIAELQKQLEQERAAKKPVTQLKPKPKARPTPAEQARREIAELNRKEKADQARQELLAAEERAKKACGVLGYTPRAGGTFSCNQPPVAKVVTPVSPKQSVACGDRLVWTEVANNDWKCLPVVSQPAPVPVVLIAPTLPQVAPPVENCSGERMVDGSVWCLEEVAVDQPKGFWARTGEVLAVAGVGAVAGFVASGGDTSGGALRGGVVAGGCELITSPESAMGSFLGCGVVGGSLGGLVNKGGGGGGSSGAGQPVESPVPSGPVESPL